MNNTALSFAAALGCLLIGANTISAATITNFSAVYTTDSPFTTTPLTARVDNGTARVTNTTVSCLSAVACSGQLLTFTIGGTGLTTATPAVIAIDGSLSGDTRATGMLNITSPLPLQYSFSLGTGNFATEISRTALPPLGNFALSGNLGLTLAAGQVLTLPSSLTFTVGTPDIASAPEPGTVALFGAGLAAVVAIARRRTRKQV